MSVVGFNARNSVVAYVTSKQGNECGSHPWTLVSVTVTFPWHERMTCFEDTPEDVLANNFHSPVYSESSQSTDRRVHGVPPRCPTVLPSKSKIVFERLESLTASKCSQTFSIDRPRRCWVSWPEPRRHVLSTIRVDVSCAFISDQRQPDFTSDYCGSEFANNVEIPQPPPPPQKMQRISIF
jgi:hypothetical protein